MVAVFFSTNPFDPRMRVEPTPDRAGLGNWFNRSTWAGIIADFENMVFDIIIYRQYQDEITWWFRIHFPVFCIG